MSPKSTLTPHAAWGIVAALWIALVINYVDRQAIFSIFPILKKEMGFTDTELGLVGTVFIWIYSLTCLLVGRVADVVRRDRLITVSIVLWSLSALGTSSSHSVGQVLFWRAMMGITEALFFPAAVSMIGSVHSDATRSRAISVYASGQMFGIVAGGWSGGWLAENWGWRPGFVLLASIGICYAPLLWLIVRRAPQKRAESNDAARPAQLLHARCFWVMALSFFWFCAMLWMLYAWLPNFIFERFHLSLADSGLTGTLFLQTSTALGVIAGGFFTDWLTRRVGAGRFYVAAMGLFVAAPFAWLALTVDSLILLKLSCCCFGFFAGFMISNVFAGPYDVIGKPNYGLGAGTMIMIGGVSGGLAMFLAGSWKQSVGIHTLMAYGSAASMLSACVMILVARLYFKEDRRRAGLPEWKAST